MVSIASIPCVVTRLSNRARSTHHYRIRCGACCFVVEVMAHGDATEGTPGDVACLAAARVALFRAHPTCVPPQAA